jgi:hypothetical protein
VIHQLKDIDYLTIDGYSRRDYPDAASCEWWRYIITVGGTRSQLLPLKRMGWRTIAIPGHWLRKVMKRLGEGTLVVYGLGDWEQPFATHTITLSSAGIEETRRLRGTTYHLEQFGDLQ